MGDQVVKAVSLDEISSMVRQAFYRAVSRVVEYPDCWVVDVYTDYCVVCEGPAGKYLRVGYTLATNGEIAFAPREQWQPVEREWVDAKAENMLVAFGGEVKSLPEDRIGGYLIVWGSAEERDLSGEYFTKATELCLDWYEKRPLLYHHGKEGTLKKTPVGFIDTLKADDTGLWMEAQLDARNRYVKAVKKLVDKGALGLSGATLGHLREVKSTGELICWPLIEGSLTPAQVEPRTYVVTLKSLPLPLELPNEPEVVTEGAVTSAPVAAASAKAVPVVQVISTNHKQEGASMSENVQTQPPAGDTTRFDQLENSMKSVSDRLDAITAALEKIPQSKNPGYYTVDGGKADPNIKSFGDFLLAIKRGDEERLEKVYNSTKAMGEDQGQNGGYLVPETYNTSLLRAGAEESKIVAAVQPMPVSSPSGKFPVLDMYAAPSAGEGGTALAGGLTVSSIAEGGAYNERQVYFEFIQYNVNKIGDKVPLSDELVQDAPIVETLLTKLIGVAISAKKERHILRGNGVGQPLGILNSPAAIGIAPDTNNTFAFADAAEIESRFLLTPGGRPYWLMHRSLKTDLAAMQVSAGGPAYIMNLSTGTTESPLLNYPILFSEHLPQADNSGCAVLADLAAYLLFERGPVRIAYSEHADFGNGNVVWRFDQRLDGQPWIRSAITQADPQGSFTTSPFVYLND